MQREAAAERGRGALGSGLRTATGVWRYQTDLELLEHVGGVAVIRAARLAVRGIVRDEEYTVGIAPSRRFDASLLYTAVA